MFTGVCNTIVMMLVVKVVLHDNICSDTVLKVEVNCSVILLQVVKLVFEVLRFQKVVLQCCLKSVTVTLVFVVLLS